MLTGTLYITSPAYDMALPCSMLLFKRWDDSGSTVPRELLCVITARRPSAMGTGSVTIEVLVSDGTYGCFILRRSNAGQATTRLVSVG